MAGYVRHVIPLSEKAAGALLVLALEMDKSPSAVMRMALAKEMRRS